MKPRLLVLAALLFTALCSAQNSPGIDSAYKASPSHHAGQETKAFGLAVVSTLVPVALGYGVAAASPDQVALPMILVAGGALIGPSVGEFYLGSRLGGTGGILIRGVGGIMVVNGVMEGLNDIFCSESCDGNDGSGLFTIGVVVYAAGTLWSLVDTHLAADRLRQGAAALPFTLAPTLTRNREGGWIPGAMASLKF